MPTNNQTSIFDKIISHDYANNIYDIQFYLMDVDLGSFDPNSSDAPKVRYKVGLSPQSIISFTIADSLSKWWTNAELVFRSALEDTIDLLNTNKAQKTKLKVLKNDGNDILYVRIVPNEKSFAPLVSQGLDITDWKLEYTFAITKIEDIDSPVGMEGMPTSQTNKCKKLYLVDYKYQKLKTTNLLYSSYMASENEAPNSRPDGKKATGWIIRDLFRLSGLQEALPKIEERDMWDDGSDKLFYTSTADSMASDDLEYALSHHTSVITDTVAFTEGEIGSVSGKPKSGSANIHDFCILSNGRDRNTGGMNITSESQPMYLGKVSLIPMSKYFEKAGNTGDTPGDFQREHFFVSDTLTNSTNPKNSAKVYPVRAPVNKANNAKKDFKLKGYSEILKYTILDMSGDVNSRLFKTTPVHSTDVKTGMFKLDLLENRVETSRRFIAQKYIKNLYKASYNGTGSEEDYFLINLNRTKGLSNMNPTSCLYGGIDEDGIRQSYGIQNLLKLGIFLNTGINFRVTGLTLRNTGVFIGIDKLNGADPDSTFDDKLLGQYFVIDVKHIFEGTSYYNDITAVKIHNFTAIPKDEGDI